MKWSSMCIKTSRRVPHILQLLIKKQEAGVVLWGSGNVNRGPREMVGLGLMTNSPKSELGAGTGAGTRLGARFGAGLWAGGGAGVGAGFGGWWGTGLGFGLWFRPGSGFGFIRRAGTRAGAPLRLATLVIALGLLAALWARLPRTIFHSWSRARPGVGARPGPGLILLALLPIFLDLFALGAATPAAVLVLRSAVAALFFLLLALALILLTTRTAAGAGCRSVDKSNWET